MKAYAVIALGAVCMLAACGPKGGANTTAAGGAPGAGGTPAAGGAPLGDTPLTFADLPRPRAGEWENTVDTGDGKPSVMRVCYSGKAPATPKMPPGCANFTFKRTLTGSIVMDFACDMQGMHMSAHSVSTGDYQGNYTTDGNITMGGGPAGASRTITTHTTAKWVGPCAPGEKAADDPQDSSAGAQ